MTAGVECSEKINAIVIMMSKHGDGVESPIRTRQIIQIRSFIEYSRSTTVYYRDVHMCPHLLYMPNCNPPVGISIHIASQGLLRFEREDLHARDTVLERKVTSKVLREIRMLKLKL